MQAPGVGGSNALPRAPDQAAPEAVPAGANVGGSLGGPNLIRASGPNTQVMTNRGTYTIPATPSEITVAAASGRLYSFDTSVGSAAPPATLFGETMTRFGIDPQPGQSYLVSSVTDPCSPGGSIGFSPLCAHITIGNGWAGWSHGYTGDVYYTYGASNVTVTLSAGIPPSCAFYFYVEPDQFQTEIFQVTADDGSSTTFQADGNGGAAYCGIFGPGLTSITIADLSTDDFAIGEFGVACICDLDVTGACCEPYTGGCNDAVLWSECAAPRQWFYDTPCEFLVPPCGNPGACCNIHTGDCIDHLLALNCTSEFHSGVSCTEMNPMCGNPGCCCDSPEPGVVTDPRIELAANCHGRFHAGVVGEDCAAGAFEPECGLWVPVGLLYAPTWRDNPEFRSTVSALLGGSPVDFWDAYHQGTPTLEYCSAYAAVMTWVNYPYADAAGMGDMLADYVDQGGRVILGQWCLHTDQYYWLEGRIMTADYCPVLSASGCSTSTYAGDGMLCAFVGSAGAVTTLSASYADKITAVEPGAFTDGHWDTGEPVVAWNSAADVFYSPGNTGTMYSSGDWAMLTANMVNCVSPLGACCDLHTGDCIDNVPPLECLAGGHKPYPLMLCAALIPACGDMGACCDPRTGGCVDDVLQANCTGVGGQPASGMTCGELNPPCGDPGCCCDRPEPGEVTDPHFAFALNCSGRFISGAYPFCGDLDENGVLDMNDYNMFLTAFGKCAGQPGYLAAADMDGDGCIRLTDFQQWRNCYVFQGTGCTADMFTPACGLWNPAGLLYAPTENDNDVFSNVLSTLLGGQPVDYFDAREATPTLDQLRQYAACLTWVNFPYNDPVAMGDVLADYVDAGGQVILGQWCFHTYQANWLQGRIMTPAYCPVARAPGYSAETYVAGSGTGVIFRGAAGDVTTLSATPADIVTAIQSWAQSDGQWGTGAPVVAYKPDLSVVYASGHTGLNLSSGDWAILTANVILPLTPDACCNIHTAECEDEVYPADCRALGPDWQTHLLTAFCADLVPPCGDPGCCCEPPEEGVLKDPVFAYAANCDGRFISGVLGADCVKEAFAPGCGMWGARDVLYAPANPDNPTFRAALGALLNANVDYFDARYATPTLGLLRNYAACFTWVGYAYLSPTAMGDVLADFVDSGGKVILGQWCFPTMQWNWLQGRIMTADYCPVLSASRYAAGAYVGDGILCPFIGSAGTVGALSAEYADKITAVQPGAFTDGQWDTGGPVVAWRAAADVFYSPGNTGTEYGSGEWALLTANMVNCVSPPGACCNIYTAECQDGADPMVCLEYGTGWQPHPTVACAALVPPCGNPGACCDDAVPSCVDGVLQAACTARFAAGIACNEMSPLCGELPPPDACVGDAHFIAPGSYSATTCGAGSDCPLSPSEDYYVGVWIPSAGNWQIDLCASTQLWDSYLYLGHGCCTNSWYDDDGCTSYRLHSIIKAAITTPGWYYATVEAFGTVCGAFTLSASTYEPVGETVGARPVEFVPSKLEQVRPELRD